MNYTLEIDENDEVDFLLGIHSNVGDYKLAYHLNALFNIQLTKELKRNLSLNKDKNTKFDFFLYEDQVFDQSWSLINNKSVKVKEDKFMDSSLFGSSKTLTQNCYYLINEFKQTDYFLKISGCYEDRLTKQMSNKLKGLDFIQMCYPIDINQLKSKDYLTF